MREDEFRVWLSGQGQANSSVSTRLADARRVEAHYGDLDAAFDADALEAILFELAYSADDRARGLANPSRLEIDGDTYDSLASYRAAVTAYRRFRTGSTAPANRQADRIRRFVTETIIEPARSRGEQQAVVVAGDVHRAMQLTNAMPAVCSALGGHTFERIANVHIVDRQGPANSSTVRFTYNLSDAYAGFGWAEAELRRRYNAPTTDTAKMVGFDLTDGRAVALQRDVTGVQLWLEDDAGHAMPPVLTVRHYLADQPRHSNLPPRLRHVATHNVEPRPVMLAAVRNLAELNDLLDWYDQAEVALDRTALERLRAMFLAQFPDFQTFEESGGYGPEEDEYKRPIIAEAQRLLIQHADTTDAVLGGALLDLAASKRHNLLGYFKSYELLKKWRADSNGMFDAAAGALVRSADDASIVIQTFVDTVWPTMAEGQASKPYGDSRIISTLLLALTQPADAIFARTVPFNNAGVTLLRRKLYGWNPLSGGEYASTRALAQAVLAVMRDEWRWKPRDLWDVQGFIWATCSKKEDEMDDAALLRRFSSPHFEAFRAHWAAEQSAAFCMIARAAHDAGLDWYHTNMSHNPVRLGRKPHTDRRAVAAFGYLNNPAAPRILLNDASGFSAVDDNEFALSAAGASAFVEQIGQHSSGIAAWQPLNPMRPGRWPDEAGSNDEDNDVKTTRATAPTAATNLILYGPPGTGKTFATAKHAVRLCGEVPPADRHALMATYRRLVDDKRIEFVTFHQSMAYEEFVEGLRPTTESSVEDADVSATGGFRLVPRDGIFKQISERARLSERGGVNRHLDRQRAVFKIALGRRGEEENRISEGLDRDLIHIGWGGDIDWSDERFDTFEPIRRAWNDAKDASATGKDPNIEMMYTFRAAMQPGDYVILSDGRDMVRGVAEISGDYFYDPDAAFHPHRRRVSWLWQDAGGVPRDRFYPRQFRRHSTYQLAREAVDWDALDEIVFGEAANPAGDALPYVLVIDEINRANISKVFGELITLLEPDKRLGSVNELKVRLPYSGDSFGVPANLHIIGTMNTADRSIALIDKALRRRFDFTEMMPDYDAPGMDAEVPGTDVTLAAVLRAINDRIEYLLDREHQIGHGWLLGCTTRDKLDAAMRGKIIPLIAEYFFEDWGRTADVLGGREDNPFLMAETLAPPPGLTTEQPRTRWSVRAGFDADAYTRLIG